MKTAVITGSNRGIGRALVEVFASAGYEVWACARKADAAFEEHLCQLEERENTRVSPMYFDLTDEAAVKNGVKKILAEKTTIDVLVNNAGAAHGGLLTMTSLDTMRALYDVNVFAPVQLMQLFGRQMMKQKKGCMINLCSVGGIETNPGYLAYGSSKAALIWITKSAAKELGAYGIRVNGIAPGLVDTEMGHYKSDEEQQRVLDRMSIKRMGKPEEIAKAALYLASEDAAFITGQILICDGGRV